MAENTGDSVQLLVTFQGSKLELSLRQGLTVGDVKHAIVQQLNGGFPLKPEDVKLMLKGKLLKNNVEDLYDTLILNAKSKPQRVYRILATGSSAADAQKFDQDLNKNVRSLRIRDDLTEEGRREIQKRQALAYRKMAEADKSRPRVEYGFGQIETLPGLPNEAEARRILTELANDPGVLACMEKHKWNVGALAEMYPEGKVGESEICIMGLNRNKGEKIFLRLRTDDLQGFRKILSIRQVLYHELAHNVHSDHDNNFFQLMRQIERECKELDWTEGAGLQCREVNSINDFSGGTFRLGGGSSDSNLSPRERAARAAMHRMQDKKEDQEEK